MNISPSLVCRKSPCNNKLLKCIETMSWLCNDLAGMVGGRIIYQHRGGGAGRGGICTTIIIKISDPPFQLS